MKINNLHITKAIKNRRDSSNIKDCSPFEFHRMLKYCARNRLHFHSQTVKMRIKVLIFSFLLLFLVQNISAQNKVSISFGGSYLYSPMDNSKLPYWENGYLFTFSPDYKITDKIVLFSSFSYQNFF